MGIIGGVAKVGETVVSGVGKVAKTAFNAQQNVAAANASRELMEDARNVEDAKNGKVHGEIYQTIDSIGDVFSNVTNHVTFGLSGRVENAFSKNKVNYSAMKQLRKENDKEGIKTTMSDLTNAGAGDVNEITQIAGMESRKAIDKETARKDKKARKQAERQARANAVLDNYGEPSGDAQYDV